MSDNSATADAPGGNPVAEGARAEATASCVRDGQRHGQRSTPESLSESKRRRLGYEGGHRGGASACSGEEAGMPDGVGSTRAAGRPPHDVVLRIEWAKSTEVKVLTMLVISCVLAGIGVTTYMKVRAAAAGTSWYLLRSEAPAFQDNLVAGCICVAASGAMWVAYLARGLWLRLQRLRWDPRRRRVFLTRLAELAAVAVSVACWTCAGDARRLERDCSSFNRTLVWTYAVRMTMANTLFALWTMTARGMTVWRGKPLSTWDRVRSAARWRSLIACCGGDCADGGVDGGCDEFRESGDVGRKAAEIYPVADVRVVAGRVAPEVGAERTSGSGSGRTSVEEAKPKDWAAADVAKARDQAAVATETAASDAAGAACGRQATGSSGSVGAARPPPQPRPGSAPSPAALPTPDPVPQATGSPPQLASSARTPFAELATGAGAAAAVEVTDAEAAPATEHSANVTAAVPVAAPPFASHASPREEEPPAVAGAGADAADVSISVDTTADSTLPAALGDVGADEMLYIDAPWWRYASPFLWLWVPFEGLVVANTVLLGRLGGWDQRQEHCLAWFLECRTANPASFTLLNVMLMAEVLYTLIYFSHCLSAFAFVRSRSYVLYRQLNIYLSVEVRIRGMVLLFIVANDLVQALYVPHVDVPGRGPQRCRYSIDIVLGNWSTQVVPVVLVCALAWLFIPRSIHGHLPLMLASLQRFAWTEPDMPAQRNRRMLDAPQHGWQEAEQLLREPMFCFETALKLTYWCEHIYYYDEEGCTMRLPLEKLMKLYDLQHVEVLREEESDAKAMIAWSPEQCLICFRGTASLKAACADLQAVLVPYYNRMAWTHVLKLAPLAAVHSGFQWSWLHGGFNRRVLQWVRTYRERHASGKIMVTGHSLGGAHAMLCTLDIVHDLGPSLPLHQLTCYTFGAPRIGNHVFATMYDKVVNETWHVINGNDMVPLTPKFVGWFVYKHPGHKVIVKRRGDLIVRPTFTENAVVRLPCSRSVRHHLLGSYIRSMMAVLRQQTRGKHIEGGTRALVRLASFKLPEVEAVHEELRREVQTVALAATRAAGSMGGQDKGPTHGATASNATAAAAAAAASAASRGATVYQTLVRHGSLRLLMWQGHSPAPPPAHELRPRQLLTQLARGVNLGMELMGVETGMGDEEAAAEGDTGDTNGGAGEHGGCRDKGRPGNSNTELAAFQRAAAGKCTARQRQRQSRRKRRGGGRLSDGGDASPYTARKEPDGAASAGGRAGGDSGKSMGANSRRRLYAVRHVGGRSSAAEARAAGAAGAGGAQQAAGGSGRAGRGRPEPVPPQAAECATVAVVGAPAVGGGGDCGAQMSPSVAI